MADVNPLLGDASVKSAVVREIRDVVPGHHLAVP